MQGKTHLSIGITGSLLIMHPHSPSELLIGTGLAAIGALICDIDLATSPYHKKTEEIIKTCTLAIIGLVTVETIGNLHLWSQTMRYYSIVSKIVAALIFMVICIFGKEQPHRCFMHSFLALITTCWCIKIMFPMAYLYYGIAYSSHLMLDMLNKKGVQLFYPYRKRLSLKWCVMGGKADQWIGTVGTLIMITTISYYCMTYSEQWLN